MLLQHALRIAQKTPSQIEYINISTATTTGINLTINTPASTLPGDLLILVYTTQSSLAPTFQSGWAFITSAHSTTSDLRSVIAYRTTISTDPTTWTVSLSGARGAQAVLLTYRNAKYKSFSGVVNSASAAFLTTQIANPSTASVLIQYSALQNSFDRTSTPPTGFIELAELYSTTTFATSNLQVSHVIPVGNSVLGTSNTWSIVGGMAAATIELVPK